MTDCRPHSATQHYTHYRTTLHLFFFLHKTISQHVPLQRQYYMLEIAYFNLPYLLLCTSECLCLTCVICCYICTTDCLLQGTVVLCDYSLLSCRPILHATECQSLWNSQRFETILRNCLLGLSWIRAIYRLPSLSCSSKSLVALVDGTVPY
jgi:hypothetical protein